MVKILRNQMSVATLTPIFWLNNFNYFLPNLLSTSVKESLIGTIMASPHACKVKERTIYISYCIPFKNKWTPMLALAFIYDQ